MKGYLKKMKLISKKIKRGGHSKKDGQKKGSTSKSKKYRRKTVRNSGKSSECSFCCPKISQRMERYANIRKKIRMNMKTLKIIKKINPNFDKLINDGTFEY